MTTNDDQLGEFLRLGFQSAPFGISIVDVHGRQIAGNQAYAALIGRTVDDLGDLDVGAMTRDDDLGWTANYLMQLVTGEIDSYATDKVYVQPDGSERRVHLVAWPVRRDGRCVGIIGALQPAPERASLTDMRTRKLIENIDNTITLVDDQGNMLETSGRHRPVLGYPAEFWETRTIFDLLHPDDAQRVLDMREAVIGDPGHVVSGTFQVRAADGAYEPVHVDAVNLLHDPDVGGIVVTSRNVGAEHAMLRELAARSEFAESEAMVRSRLIATVSHELRNPLHAMSGISELLATSGLPEAQASLASTLHRQILALGGVLDDLLESSRLDAAGITLKTNSVNVVALLDDVVALARAAAQAGVAVLARVDAGVPSDVEADASRLRQVLSNLMGNAAKFTEHGTIEIAADMTIDGQVRFTVSDTGRGIPSEDLERIFDPFVAAGNAGASTGAGLGLTIVRQLVAAMHGHVAAGSRLGDGSTFTVVLPLKGAAARRAVVPATTERTGRTTVLVVEDNDVNQLLARSQMERLGMDCIIVDTGEAALELIAAGDAPQLILMDFQLPGIDGLETTRRLRAMETDGSHRIVIGVTASAMAADRSACSEAGMDDFLAKPVGLAELGETLQRWIGELQVMAAGDPAPSAAPADAGEIVDRSVLDQLVDELSPEMVQQLVRTYLGELDRRREMVIAAAAAGELDGARRVAHTLKASSQLLGATELGEACRALEHLTDAHGLTELAGRVTNLTHAVGVALNAWLREGEATAS